MLSTQVDSIINVARQDTFNMFNLKLTSIGDVLHLSIHGRRAVVEAIPDESWNLDGDQEIGSVLNKMVIILTWVCSPETLFDYFQN